MRKIVSALGIVVLLWSMLAIFVPITAMAQSTIAPVATSYDLSYKRLSFDALNLQWAFYSDGSSLLFKTSDDLGYSWSNATVIVTPYFNSEGVSVYTDGTYGYYIRTDAIGLDFNRGLLNGNGTIAWTGEQNIPGISGGQYSMVTVDSAGYPVIAWYKSSYGAMITTDANNDGTWSTGTEVNIAGGYGYAMLPYVIPLASRELVFIGATNIGTPLQAAYFNGATWSGVISGNSSVKKDSNSWPAFSVVPAGSLVEIGFLTTGNVLKVVRYIPGTNVFTSETTIGSAAATSFPSLSATASGNFFIFWQDSPSVNDISYSYQRSTGTWSAPALLIGNETLPAGNRFSTLKTAELTRESSEGVYFVNAAGNLKFQGVYMNVYPPEGGCLAAGNITAYSATISGQVVFGGNWTSFCHAVLGVASIFFDEQTYDVPGNVTTGEVVSYTFTGLIPGQTYSYYLELHNEAGDWYPSGNLPEFSTLASGVDSIPIAETETALQDVKLTSVDVLFNGAVVYDGNLDCVGGFEYRVLGSGTWIPVQNTDILHTHDVFEKVVGGLGKNVTYEWRATVTNALGTGYGDTKPVLTRGVALPTPTPGGGILPPCILPPSVTGFFARMSGNLKLIVAVIITLGAMILVGGKVKSKAVGLLVLATGFACVILFTFVGWFPMYVIILVGGVVALLLFLSIQGRK